MTTLEEFFRRDGVIDIDRIEKIDAETKPADFDRVTSDLRALYEDGLEAGQVVRHYNEAIGVGLSANSAPPQPSQLRYVVHRVAGRYDSPATRTLGSDPADEELHSLYGGKGLGFDAVMKQLDRLSILCTTSFMLAAMTRHGIQLRIFSPDQVMRVTDEDNPSELRDDLLIAIKGRGGMTVFGRGPLPEDESEPQRTMWRVDDEGRVLSAQQLDPYGNILPVIQLPSGPLAGHAWLQPSTSRFASACMSAALLADLQVAAVKQAHSQMIFQTRNPERAPPAEVGPGHALKIHADDALNFAHPAPDISGTLDIEDRVHSRWLTSEAIPTAEIHGQTVLTGAALLVAERPLEALRKEGLPAALHAEQRAYEIIARLQNVGYGGTLPVDAELSVTFGSAQRPLDKATMLDAAGRAEVLGAQSRIDTISELWNVPRAEALEIFDRVEADRQLYAATELPEASVDVMAAAGEDDVETADSMADLVRAPAVPGGSDARR